MATTGSDLSTSFTIKEISGAIATRRTLVLRERALPYRPFELSGTQRNTIDWYPGSPIGTLQVYGAKEEPTTINGQWKDKFLAANRFDLSSFDNAPAVLNIGSATPTFDENNDIVSGQSTDILDSARALTKLVDDMRRKGQEVEVTWLDQIRRGIIERFTVKWATGHDCEWELAFAWTSQGESLQDVTFINPATDLADIPNEVQARIDRINIQDTAELVPQAGTRFADVASVLNNVGARIQDFADQLTDAVASASSAISQPSEALQRVAGILDGIKLSANLLSEIAEEGADGVTLDSGAISSINDTIHSFGKILFTRAEIRDRSDASVSLRNVAASQQAILLKRINNNVVSVFQAREGQDLRYVSQAYYDTPDEWRSLMVYNNLSSSGLQAGQVIFVPASPQKGPLC